MSEISSVTGKSEIFKVQGIDIELKSSYINLDDLPDLIAFSEENKEALTLEEKKEKGRIMANLIFKVLKKSLPDATDDEVKEFGLKNMKVLMQSIIKISGLQNDD